MPYPDQEFFDRNVSNQDPPFDFDAIYDLVSDLNLYMKQDLKMNPPSALGVPYSNSKVRLIAFVRYVFVNIERRVLI